MPRRIEVNIKVDVFRNCTPLFADVADNFFNERPQSETSSTTSDERPSLPFAASSTSRFSSTIHNVNLMDDQNVDNNETSNDYLLCKILQDEYDGEYAAFWKTNNLIELLKKVLGKIKKKVTLLKSKNSKMHLTILAINVRNKKN